jgi:hypothetical protein
VVLLLIAACDDDEGIGGARARAGAFLDEHPTGTAFAQAGIGREDLDAVSGPVWEGVDLAAWFKPCGGAPANAFDAELRVGPGAFPWPYEAQTSVGPISSCAWDRLATFPFDGPTLRGQEDLVVVRWRPGETAPVGEEHTRGSRGLPPGALAQTPPYFRTGPGIDWASLVLDEAQPRFRTDPGPIQAGPLAAAEAIARKLSCPGEGVDLVRVHLVMEDGYVDEVATRPETPCVQIRAHEAETWLGNQVVDEQKLRDLRRVMLVLDVPVGTW